MANPVTNAQVRGLARLYCDQRPGGANAFIPDLSTATTVGVNGLVNLAMAELYDLLVAARGQEYFLTTATLTLVSGTALYSLPATFYEMSGLVLEWGTQEHEPVEDLEKTISRTQYVNMMGPTWAPWSEKAYRLRGAQIEFVPAPSGAMPPTTRLYFVPAFVPSDPTQAGWDAVTFDSVNGWEKLPALRTAMEMRAIEEVPYGDLEKLYERELARVETMKAEREASRPKRIINVYPERRGYMGRWP